MKEQTLPKEMLPMAAAQEENEDKLLALDNVVGVALGNRVKDDQETDEPVVSVLVNRDVFLRAPGGADPGTGVPVVEHNPPVHNLD